MGDSRGDPSRDYCDPRIGPARAVPCPARGHIAVRGGGTDSGGELKADGAAAAGGARRGIQRAQGRLSRSSHPLPPSLARASAQTPFRRTGSVR